jgi:low temperature requirement protein LtrA
MSRFQRAAGDPERQRATSLELFYDLVFVFAVTQVSHLLLRHLDWAGVGQSALVLMVVWWSWNYTTWVTNELDPESVVVRLMLIAVMLASLLMAVAIPEAFGDRALLFAGAYVAIQCGRHLFLAFAAHERGTPERERAERILIWFAIAGVFWIAGALVAEGTPRTLLWLIALTIDWTAPRHLYWLPGKGGGTSATWEVQTSHFAERFQLFVIIALGESIVLTGAPTSELELTGERLLAFAVAFLTTAAMWWLYFNYVATIAERRLELSPERTTLARDGYTYLHVVLIAGVIVSAVGDELTIAHPGEVLPGKEVAISVAGPAIYLLGHSLFRWRLTGSPGWKRPAGALACVAVGLLFGAWCSALVVAALVLATLVAVIAAEYLSGRRRAARGEPTPLEALNEQSLPS